MPYDSELVGFLSAADSLEHLLTWFPREDLLRLQAEGFRIHTYEAEEVKFYAPYQHNVIRQSTSRLVDSLLLT